MSDFKYYDDKGNELPIQAPVQNGGPAFPGLDYVSQDGKVNPSGMSLRDYFAAKAMAAYWADPDVTSDFETAAAWAYDMADAMLAAREAK